MRGAKAVGVLLIAIAMFATYALGQTASTATMTGTVTDQSGAVVPSATVELRDINTNQARTATTGDTGVYTFPNVMPGTYKLTVTAKGFKQAVLPRVPMSVGKSPSVNVKLQVGAEDTVVEVHGAVGTELQTLDASVGNVITSRMLDNMPSVNRDATALLLIQPMAAPAFNQGPASGESNTSGGQVAGARSDQNTFTLDGGDASSNTEGTGGYNTQFVATPRAVVPTPVESLEEFRVATNNQGATFNRSSGAEVQMVTRRGTNDWHGAIYEYLQNDNTNANNWILNHIDTKRPELRDNRFGGRIGGPIIKNKTFFFLLYEGRRFARGDTQTRFVPTAAMRAGILKYKDAAGNTNAFNLNCAPTVDPDSGAVVAPSGLDPFCATGQGGLSPAIKAVWDTMPLPNDFTTGDGLRRAGFTAPITNTTNENTGVARLDHEISQNWHFMSSYRYSVSDVVPSTVQYDIGGITPGAIKGVPKSTAFRPLQPRYFVAGLTGQITPNVTNEFHFDYLRHWWFWGTAGTPNPAANFSDAAIQIWSESRTQGMVPVNIDTQQARTRTWNGRDYNFSDNINWLKGKHMFQFGGRYMTEHFFHDRNDKVVGGLTQPVYYATRGGNYTHIGGFGAFAPPICSDAVTTGCLQQSDFSNYRNAYISVTGMIDTASQVLTRSGDLSPNPAGTHIQQNAIVNTWDLHFADTWRLTNSLTVTYGLSWGAQLPPYEVDGLQTLPVFAETGQIVDQKEYLRNRQLAALNGQPFNPVLGVLPIRFSSQKYPYNPDYTDWSPRLAIAWNPSVTGGGWLGSILGDRKTVFRAGYARMYDRLNGVGIIMTPALSVGFGDLSVCTAPNTAGVCAGGTTPADAFRIGVNGNHINIPSLPVISGTMIIPGLDNPAGIAVPGANSIYEGSDSRIDLNRKVGYVDSYDFSIQRELPHGMLLELGYVGKISQRLLQNVDPNAVPYMMTLGGQQFSAAWDALARQMRPSADGGQGIAAASVAPQPWFETMFGGAGSTYCAGFASCTAAFATNEQDNILLGAVTDAWYNSEGSFVTGPLTVYNTQIQGMDNTASNGYANYSAGFVTLRKRLGTAQFDVNYTLSHSLDFIGLNQENTDALPDTYFPFRTYGPSQFDRRHTLNALVSWDLPFGAGKRFTTGGALDKLIGGWTVAGTFTMGSGLPLFVWDSGADFGEFGGNPNNVDAIGMVLNKPTTPFSATRVDPGAVVPDTSGNGWGSASADQGVPNAFGNPGAIAPLFRHLYFSDTRAGQGSLRGLWRWNADVSFAKSTKVTERFGLRFDVQMLNVFNHPQFASNNGYFNSDYGTDVSDPSNFGVLNSQYNAPRFIQWGLRLDW